MKTQIKDSQAVDRTIRGFLYSCVSDQLVIHFKDDTFTAFGVVTDDESLSGVAVTNEPLRWADFGSQDLIKAGIASRQELDDLFEGKKRRQQDKKEQHERREYLRLKAKYARRGKGKKIAQVAIRRSYSEGGLKIMGLQDAWDKSEMTEENIKIKETLFTDDLTRLYRFDSKRAANRVIEVYEGPDILKVRYIEKELDLGTVDISE